MADINKIRLTKGAESEEYNIADTTARSAASAAKSAASAAQSAASAAQTAASAAQNTANSNKTLIDSLTYVQATVKDVTLVLTEKEGAN